VFQSYGELEMAFKLSWSTGISTEGPYEKFRYEILDPLLDTNPSGWDALVAKSVKEHYEVVRDLLAKRIVGLFYRPPWGLNVIADCKVAMAPAPPPKPATAGRRK
jgi:hypothetical protein